MEDLNSVFDGLEGLFTSSGNRVTERHLGLQFPGRGNTPFLLDGFINQGAVMLKGAAEAFSFKGSPDDELDHTRGVFSETGESGSVQGERVLELLDGRFIFEEQDGTITSTETLHLGFSGGEVFSGDDTLEDIRGGLPEFIGLFLEQDDSSGSLGVERRRSMLDGKFDDFLNLSFSNLDVLVKSVVSSSFLNSLDERFGVHVDGMC